MARVRLHAGPVHKVSWSIRTIDQPVNKVATNILCTLTMVAVMMDDGAFRVIGRQGKTGRGKRRSVRPVG